jgi:two-component sensor histidine kinase
MERQALLSGELQHRIKNTLAMVSAISNQTMRGDSVKAARQAFEGRLATLSSAHDILTQTSWSEAPIVNVIDGALAAHRAGQGRIHASGPDVLLQPKQALSLALAVHELATNAAKYGALSTDGKVDISWGYPTNTDGAVNFKFTWKESGGPPVSQPSKRGFGSRLIETMLGSDFDGKVHTFYKPDGLVCELVAPHSAIANKTHAMTAEPVGALLTP